MSLGFPGNHLAWFKRGKQVGLSYIIIDVSNNISITGVKVNGVSSGGSALVDPVADSGGANEPLTYPENGGGVIYTVMAWLFNEGEIALDGKTHTTIIAEELHNATPQERMLTIVFPNSTDNSIEPSRVAVVGNIGRHYKVSDNVNTVGPQAISSNNTFYDNVLWLGDVSRSFTRGQTDPNGIDMLDQIANFTETRGFFHTVPGRTEHRYLHSADTSAGVNNPTAYSWFARSLYGQLNIDVATLPAIWADTATNRIVNDESLQTGQTSYTIGPCQFVHFQSEVFQQDQPGVGFFNLSASQSTTLRTTILNALIADLSTAHSNRAEVPWIVVVCNRSFLQDDTTPTTDDLDRTEAGLLRDAFDLYQVDFVLSGKREFYARSEGDYFSTATQLINGASGYGLDTTAVSDNMTLNKVEFGFYGMGVLECYDEYMQWTFRKTAAKATENSSIVWTTNPDTIIDQVCYKRSLGDVVKAIVPCSDLPKQPLPDPPVPPPPVDPASRSSGPDWKWDEWYSIALIVSAVFILIFIGLLVASLREPQFRQKFKTDREAGIGFGIPLAALIIFAIVVLFIHFL